MAVIDRKPLKLAVPGSIFFPTGWIYRTMIINNIGEHVEIVLNDQVPGFEMGLSIIVSRLTTTRGRDRRDAYYVLTPLSSSWHWSPRRTNFKG